MKNIYKILLLCLLMMPLLASCGRYSPASPVEGSGYPHNYPHGGE